MRFELKKPNKEVFFNTLQLRKSVSYMDEIWWLVNSDLDISFYRDEGDKIIEISKEEMKIAVDQNWEMR